MAMRAREFGTPYVNTDVKEFVSHVVDTKVIRVSLGFPLPQHTPPGPFK